MSCKKNSYIKDIYKNDIFEGQTILVKDNTGFEKICDVIFDNGLFYFIYEILDKFNEIELKISHLEFQYFIEQHKKYINNMTTIKENDAFIVRMPKIIKKRIQLKYNDMETMINSWGIESGFKEIKRTFEILT